MSSSWFQSRETTSHEITDPDTGETATIQVRELNAGDQAAIHDSIRMMTGDDPHPDVRLGAFRLLMVERALVSWTLPLAVSPQTIKELKPEIFNAIFDIINDEGQAQTETPLVEENSSEHKQES